MRNIFFLTSFIILSFFAGTSATAQARIGCVDKSMRIQAEDFKSGFEAQGMVAYKDAMLSMMPKQPYPIAIQLSAKEIYQFIFVGNHNSDKLYFELYDGNDKKLAEKVIDNEVGKNFILYSFIPEKSDLYLVVVSQKVKGKREVCGSFTIMKKSGNK